MTKENSEKIDELKEENERLQRELNFLQTQNLLKEDGNFRIEVLRGMDRIALALETLSKEEDDKEEK